jgi:lysozyme
MMQPPPGWLEGRRLERFISPAEAETVEFGQRFSLSELGRVNADANRLMPWKQEAKDAWGLGSDCEDIAIAKRDALVRLGWPAGALRLTVMRTSRGEGHCVLSVMQTEGEPWILDNRTTPIFVQSKLEKAGDVFLARECPGDLLWRRLGGGAKVVSLADAVKQAKKEEGKVSKGEALGIDRLKADLARDEARRRKPYRDSVGKLSIGVGRNLDDVGLREDEIDLMLSNDIRAALADLDRALPWWRGMTEARQRGLANMCFNMGLPKLLGFRNMLAAMEVSDWPRAASEALDSKWARQVGDRAERIAAAFKSGQ